MELQPLIVQFDHFGPYHLARIRSCHEFLARDNCEVIGLETRASDATYAWHQDHAPQAWRRVVVPPADLIEPFNSAKLQKSITSVLHQLNPLAMAIAGWGTQEARICLRWCKQHGVKALVMSETREADGRRVWWREWVKRRIIRRFDAGLVGGKSHRDYLIKLGMPENRIALGYDVVDNDYFKAESGKWRAETNPMDAVPRYFLASNRFIERKNLGRLIEAFSEYVQSVQPSMAGAPKSRVWSLCLLGDGELKRHLMKRCRELALRVIEYAPWELVSGPRTQHQEQGAVYFPGFRQIEELPRFYAHAGCFVHPALEEPWGLVINEAMACGLPILSGNNVGAAEELVEQGVNGWTFDATSTAEIADLMIRISAPDFPRSQLGAASARILEERCPMEAFGRGLAELLCGSDSK